MPFGARSLLMAPGVCCSSSPAGTSPSYTVRVSRHHRPRGIVNSIVASGTARIIYNEALGLFNGNLIAEHDDSYDISGKLETSHSPTEPSTSLANIFITDGETGERYSLLRIPVEFFVTQNAVTKSTHNHFRIKHSAISFESKDVLIGDRAELEIQRHMGATLSPQEHPGKHGGGRRVHVGEMALKIVTSQKIEPGFRRESICDHCTLPIVEQSDDFLV